VSPQNARLSLVSCDISENLRDPKTSRVRTKCPGEGRDAAFDHDASVPKVAVYENRHFTDGQDEIGSATADQSVSAKRYLLATKTRL
jgi:hypothetical protein